MTILSMTSDYIGSESIIDIVVWWRINSIDDDINASIIVWNWSKPMMTIINWYWLSISIDDDDIDDNDWPNLLILMRDDSDANVSQSMEEIEAYWWHCYWFSIDVEKWNIVDRSRDWNQ